MNNRKFIRIIPKLDIKNGMLIKGINLEGLRVLGDPFNFVKYYYEANADEICYIDNVATLYGTNNLSRFISHTAKNIFIPISVGGGIRKITDRYFNEIMSYLKIKPEFFLRLVNKFRSPHLWKKINNNWKLRHTVNKDGTDD